MQASPTAKSGLPESSAAEQPVQQDGSGEAPLPAEQEDGHQPVNAASSAATSMAQEQPMREEQHVVTPIMSAPKAILSRPQERSKGDADQSEAPESQPSVSRQSIDSRQQAGPASTSQPAKPQATQASHLHLSQNNGHNSAFTLPSIFNSPFQNSVVLYQETQVPRAYCMHLYEHFSF